MTALAATTLTGRTLLNVVVGGLVAGIGVTLAFSTVIYCSDRASELHRDQRQTAAAAMSAAGLVALAVCLGLVVYGLILVTSKLN
jgi:hypothetical protein